MNYGHIERLLGKPIDPVFWFMQRVPFLVEIARDEGKKDAYSYRDFHVAGAAIAINSDEKIFWSDVAGNLKRENKNKICVERKLEGRARRHAMTDLVGFIVLGTTDRQQIEAVSGLPTPTLHWCADCRHDIPASPIVSPNALVVTCGLDSDVNQTFLAHQVVDMYREAERGHVKPALLTAQPDFTDWEQRVATYQVLSGGEEAVNLPLEMRQRLAQLALNKEVTI